MKIRSLLSQLARSGRTPLTIIAIMLVSASRAHDTPSNQYSAPIKSGGGQSSKAKRPAYHPTGTISGEPLDEAMGGQTLLGTPVTPRTAECFPAEPRDLFWKMDWVPGKDGQLVPLDFDEDGDGAVSNADRDAHPRAQYLAAVGRWQ